MQGQGKISLADPLSRWIPELRYQPDPRIAQVMQMVAGIPGAEKDPGDLLLGRVIERAGGQSLEAAPPTELLSLCKSLARGRLCPHNRA